MPNAYASNYLNDKELENALINLVEKMKEKGLVDHSMDTREILEKIMPALQHAAKENKVELTRDFLNDPANLKKLTSVIICATLEIQFKDHPTLKNKFNTAALALFLLDPEHRLEKRQELVMDEMLKLAAAALMLARLSPRPQPGQKATPGEKEDLSLIKKIETAIEKSADLLFEQFYGQDKYGNIHPVLAQITDSIGITEQVGKLGAGLGGLLEELANDNQLLHAPPRLEVK